MLFIIINFIISCTFHTCSVNVIETQVTYASSHVGHKGELKHTSLTKSERQQVAGLLMQGCAFESTLNKVRDSLSASSVSRLHLFERQDLKNIIRDFHINRRMYDADDSRSVRIWIELCKREGINVVRMVKFQGEEDPSGQLQSKDFILIIMTDVQVISELLDHGNCEVNWLITRLHFLKFIDFKFILNKKKKNRTGTEPFILFYFF